MSNKHIYNVQPHRIYPGASINKQQQQQQHFIKKIQFSFKFAITQGYLIPIFTILRPFLTK